MLDLCSRTRFLLLLSALVVVALTNMVMNTTFAARPTETQEAVNGVHIKHFQAPNDILNASSIPTDTIPFQVTREVDIGLVNSTNPFFFCAAPKTGCTAWLGFIRYVNDNILLKDVAGDPAGVHVAAAKVKSKYVIGAANETTAGILYDLFRRHDRFLVARNPYVRFVSSYQDWIGRQWHVAKNVTFVQFLEMYKARNFSSFPATLYDHIDPVSKRCGFERIGYTSVLRVEEQALWFDAFVAKYNLVDALAVYEESGNILFQHTLNSQTPVVDYVDSIVGATPWPGKLLQSAHHRGSSNKLGQFYTTREIVEDVTALFHSDFTHFSYPVWDGNPRTFRYV